MGVPHWLEPMAATLTAERFYDPAWTYERKLDGIRMLAFKDGGAVRLLSRNRLSLTEGHHEVARAVAALPVDSVVLDGEATGAWGRQPVVLGASWYHEFDAENRVPGDALFLNMTLPLGAHPTEG